MCKILVIFQVRSVAGVPGAATGRQVQHPIVLLGDDSGRGKRVMATLSLDIVEKFGRKVSAGTVLVLR